MATLADELLNDFEDSGDEQNEGQNGVDEDEQLPSGTTADREPMTVDANEDAMSEDGGADEEEIKRLKAEAADDATDNELDEEAAHRSKVEKMQLGGTKSNTTRICPQRNRRPI